jgi:hypothetical protein
MLAVLVVVAAVVVLLAVTLLVLVALLVAVAVVVLLLVDPLPVACHSRNNKNGPHQLYTTCQSHWRISAKGSRKR